MLLVVVRPVTLLAPLNEELLAYWRSYVAPDTAPQLGVIDLLVFFTLDVHVGTGTCVTVEATLDQALVTPADETALTLNEYNGPIDRPVTARLVPDIPDIVVGLLKSPVDVYCSV